MNNASVSTSLNGSELVKRFKTLLSLIVFLLFILFGTYAIIMIMQNPNNNNNRENQNEETKGKGRVSDNNSKLDIKIDSDKKMHQLGDHFNKHGRNMGYSSKKEYGDAALKFAQENSKNPNAEIFEGQWNGRGMVGKEKQIAILFDNKTAILDKITGQLINFYEGAELRGLINLLKLQ